MLVLLDLRSAAHTRAGRPGRFPDDRRGPDRRRAMRGMSCVTRPASFIVSAGDAQLESKASALACPSKAEALDSGRPEL